jgi:hypothetical protein
MASIETNYALAGSHIPQTGFVADGTFADDGGPIIIACFLSRGGSPISSGAVSIPSPGVWRAGFGTLTPNTGYTLSASIAGSPADRDDQPNITVDPNPLILLFPLPPLPPMPAPPGAAVVARVPITVTGTHHPSIKHIVCAAALYEGGGNSKKIDRMDAVAIGSPNDPAIGQWKAVLDINPVPAGRKIGVIATGFDNKGRILSRVFRRRS